jgi:hypothetical protein
VRLGVRAVLRIAAISACLAMAGGCAHHAEPGGSGGLAFLDRSSHLTVDGDVEVEMELDNVRYVWGPNRTPDRYCLGVRELLSSLVSIREGRSVGWARVWRRRGGGFDVYGCEVEDLIAGIREGIVVPVDFHFTCF